MANKELILVTGATGKQGGSTLGYLRSAPNLFRIVANSPAGLEGYLGLNGALGKGQLDVGTRNRIALTVADANGCTYCLSAHTYPGKNIAKLDEAEMVNNQRGASSDPKADVAVAFAGKLVKQRGHVTEVDVQAVKNAGYNDAFTPRLGPTP